MLINIKQLKLHVKTSHERKYLLPNKTFLNIVTVLSRLQINDVAKISMLNVKRGMSIWFFGIPKNVTLSFTLPFSYNYICLYPS